MLWNFLPLNAHFLRLSLWSLLSHEALLGFRAVQDMNMISRDPMSLDWLQQKPQHKAEPEALRLVVKPRDKGALST